MQVEMEESTHTHARRWYRLDNTANLYPSVLTRRNTTMYRLSVTLRKPVHVDRLRRAVEPVMARFPYYRVQLRGGAFWYTFEENNRLPKPVIDSRTPCGYMPIKKRGVFPFRIRAFGRVLALEFSHTLTDGTGALLFLKSLLSSYILADMDPEDKETRRIRKLCGEDPMNPLFTEDGDPAEVQDDEYEDAFRTYYDKSVPSMEQEKKVYHQKGRMYKTGYYRVITGEVPIQKVLSLAKERGVSLTEYLTSIYFYALQRIQEHGERKRARKRWDPISVMVPINLRSILPSNTMRNFFLTLNPTLDTRLGHYDFEEISEKVRLFMRTQTDHRHLKQQLARNVRGRIHPLIRVAPLFVKDPALKMIHHGKGESRYSGSLSNIGKVVFSSPIEELVERVHLLPPPSPVLGIKCGVVSYGGVLSITFGSLLEETVLERLFFTFLRKEGVPVYLRGNWKGEC
ncbi:MAG: hypothetical protein ACLFQW_06805 [Spirochaetaceae bacterium]